MPTSGPNGEDLVSKTESQVGKYADIDGDGTVDGIIFADLLFGRSGKWENENRGKYSIPTITTSKEYYVSQNSYTNNLGGTAEVLSPTGKGNNRFYIMSLSDIDSNTHTWYAGAYDGGIEDYNIITSKEFCASKSNSITMIKNGILLHMETKIACQNIQMSRMKFKHRYIKAGLFHQAKNGRRLEQI